MEIIKGIRTTRGANLSLNGDAEKILSKTITSSTYALKPDDFFGMTPKLLVKEGSELQKGQAVFFSKSDPRIKFVSPISGTLKTIQRGAKRKIEKIIIERSKTDETIQHDVKNWQSLGKDALINLLLESGNWPFIKQRPYGILANPEDTPKAIFVSTFDTAPMAIDFQYVLRKDQTAFQTGIDVLNRLVDQPTFLGVDKSFSGFFEKIKNVQSYGVSGPHPAGNVSLHIQKLCPLNMGDRIWTVRAEDVANIGRFFNSGHFSPIRTVAVAGNAVQNPKYFPTQIGVEIKSLLEDLTLENNIRVINGDVLSGATSHSEDHLGYFNNLVSVIPEGNAHRLFGWLPFKDNQVLSISNTSLSRLFGKKRFNVDTNLNGEERALVVTGEMEKVFPLDIYPMQLIKACMIEDIEKMEALGIYEVVPEDFGLIDYANTSKLEAQEIIRQGIELMIKEVG